MYVFGNEMTHGGAWTVGVIVLQRDDSETFEVYIYLHIQNPTSLFESLVAIFRERQNRPIKVGT